MRFQLQNLERNLQHQRFPALFGLSRQCKVRLMEAVMPQTSPAKNLEANAHQHNLPVYALLEPSHLDLRCRHD